MTTINFVLLDDRPSFVNAEDPASYLLVRPGPDGAFATTSCGGAVGDDEEVVSVGLSGSAPGDGTLAGSISYETLDAGLYRFFICDAITDGFGNPLDGDGNGTAGGDFDVVFRADPGNLLANSHFDDCPVTLTPWVLDATAPNEILPGSLGVDDHADSPLSASARMIQSSSTPTAMAQCVALPGSSTYETSVSLRFEPVASATATFIQACETFDGVGCSGSSLGLTDASTLFEDQEDWVRARMIWNAAPEALSALCDYSVIPDGVDDEFDLYLDGYFVGDALRNGALFFDGFESGDFSAWSTTSP